jgi:hypothetical protein
VGIIIEYLVLSLGIIGIGILNLDYIELQGYKIKYKTGMKK